MGEAEAYRVTSIESNTELLISESLEKSPSKDEYKRYERLGRVDHSKVFDTVFHSLAVGGCIGILPEGGSHDRTDLLPLKPGIAIIALGVIEKFDINVPILPVGLNYVETHSSRGRVVVQFGPPIFVNEDMMEVYR